MGRRLRNHEDRAVHLGSTSDHVLDVVSVTWAVHVSVVTSFGLVLNVRRVDGDTALLLFGSLVDLVVTALLSHPSSAMVLVIAAVNVVLPWST